MSAEEQTTESDAAAVASIPEEVVEDPAEFGDGGAPDLDDPSLYFARQLSWMDFNDRVLQLVEDETIPLLERVKFAAIWESNLDEEYMVRVAGLEDQIEAAVDPGGADELSAFEQVAAIREGAISQRARLHAAFDGSLRPALAEHGIRVIDFDEATEAEHTEMRELFEGQVFPALTPLVIGMGRPFPYISNLSLSLLVALRDADQDAEVLARVKVPKELLRRFILLKDGVTMIPMEELIARNLSSLFPGMAVIDQGFFRVTRDTDYNVSDEADDLRQAVEDEIRARRFGEVIRLEVSSGMNPRLRERLIAALDIEDRQIYEHEGLLGLDDFFDIADVSGFANLRFPLHRPVTRPALQGKGKGDIDVMEAMREGDILVHHPYDSFATSVESFVGQAVKDPEVLAIKITIYRTSADSPMIRSLMEASERGKQAVCMVELKARFDEQANIEWAQRLEQAGVHIVYGIPSLKTHAKCTLVARREGAGVRHYAHIGTGNYNAKTARIYTDLGLFTTDPDICADLAEMFNYLTGYAHPQDYRKALIAPHNLQEKLLEQIKLTIEAHSESSPGRIKMKMNSLLDAPMIKALYEASQAGVEVKLNVRGICALRPGVPGVSEKITVVSVLGRFLEHSRLYVFERNGESYPYMGSADLMPRNLYNRVELVVPVEDEAAKRELIDVLDLGLAERMGAWELGADGGWSRRERSEAEQAHMQQRLIERHSSRAAESGMFATGVHQVV